MTYTLIIAEKPDAAARIAEALDDYGKPAKETKKDVPYYSGRRDGKRFIVCSARGHLYTVTSEDREERFHYPVFSFRWAPKYRVERGFREQETWIEVIRDLGKNADDFVNACDYDLEGSLIGFNVFKYALSGAVDKAKRMKYSTLTRVELADSYSKLLEHLDFSLVEAGKTRHEVDWLYGINLSRAIMKAVYASTGRQTTLSIGRVQGPALKFLVEREKEIRSFVPTPYWSIRGIVEINGQLYEAQFEKEKINRREDVKRVVEACSWKDGVVDSVEVSRYSENPPTPFDIGSMQAEAYRLFGYTPLRTLSLAERLYLDALISYPRTGSQKLPPTIGYKEILRSLGKIPEYASLIKELLTKKLIPNEGTKTDPAHPAIYPTGNLPMRELSTQELKLYDLVVRRFLSVFSISVKKERTKNKISCNEFFFNLYGRRILEQGWIKFYKPYVKGEEILLPEVKKGQIIPFHEVIAEEKFTAPPPRYNPSSLLKFMEEQNIGTKATRAGIIETLFDRGYIRDEKRIHVTELGFDVVETFKDLCPDILSVDLTRKLERDMELIEDEKKRREETLQNAVVILRKALVAIKNQENQIGARLAEASRRAWLDKITIANCPSCETGKLLIIKSKVTGKIFVGCSNYQNGTCHFTAPLPQSGTVQPTGRFCQTCGYPLVVVRRKKGRPWNLCINISCPLKEKWRKK